jgi:hypothetical protein
MKMPVFHLLRIQVFSAANKIPLTNLSLPSFDFHFYFHFYFHNFLHCLGSASIYLSASF